ncbi:MAG: 30S ribosome-binding factor RbfA [Alphaproteobacteria bacterium]
MPAHRRAAKGPSQRQLRVGELIRHTLSEIFARGELRDPDVENTIITVSEVRVSPDLKNATVFVAPLGGGDAGPLLKGLKRSRRYLRGELGRRIETKFTPDLTFIEDTSFDEAQRVEDLLRSEKVAADLTAQDGSDPDDDQEFRP